MNLSIKLEAKMLNPVQWTNKYLKDPNYENKDFKLRHYQEDIINFCPTEHYDLTSNLTGSEPTYDFWNTKLAVAIGRGGGLTTTLASRVLYNICENNNYKIIFIVPYIAHITEITEDIRNLCKPVIMQELKFSNHTIKNIKTNSEVRFFPAGISSATKGENIHGQRMNVDEIIVENAPMIPNVFFEQEVNSIVGINPKTVYIITGQRPEAYPDTFYAQVFMSDAWKKLRIPATNWLTHKELCEINNKSMCQDFFESEMLCKRVVSFVEC